MSDTAYTLYSEAISGNYLAASVPIEDGLATVVFGIELDEDIVHLAFSDDWRERAELAVFACRATQIVAEEDLGLQTP